MCRNYLWKNMRWKNNMLIDRELERRAYMFYESIDNYINKHIVSDEQVKNELINILRYVFWEGKI